MEKGPNAYRTISEVAGELSLPQHVLRFWETRFSQIRPLKRSGGRRYYRPNDIRLLHGIRHLLYEEGYTIKGAQRILRERGVGFVVNLQGAGDKMSDSSQISGQPLDAAPMDIPPQSGRFDSSGDNSQIVSSDLPQLDLDLNLSHDSMRPDAAQIDDDDPLAGGSEMEPPVTRGRKLMRKILGSDGADGRLSAAQLETLQETIGELLSCKRMLDGHHDT